MARRDGKKVRLISRKGKDLTYRFPLFVQAVAALPVRSCLIDGEAMISNATGLAVFSLVRSYRNGPRATLCAFDLIEIDGRHPPECRDTVKAKGGEVGATKTRVWRWNHSRSKCRKPPCF
jgi:ATP-dependent DNA ligase